MQLHTAIEAFLDHRRQRSAGTRRQYRHWLESWRDWRAARDLGSEISDVTIEDFRAYLRYLEDEHIAHADNPHRNAATRPGLAPASIAAARRTLRAFWNYLDGEELLSDRQARFFRNNRIPAPVVEEAPRPYCDEATLARLVAACDQLGDDAPCVRAILHVLYDSGVRVAELCSLVDEQVNLTERRAMVRGKGGKWRPVFWTPVAGAPLIAYVLQRPGARGAGPLLRNSAGEALTPDTVRSRVKRVARLAGVELPAGSPCHWFRHSFAKRALLGDISDVELAQLLGHASLDMTLRYARELPERVQGIYERAFGGLDSRGGGSYTTPQQVKKHS